jgi:4-hydroxybenzoate polyprenyltransferase
MVKYLRLIRLQDEYIQVGAAIFAGIFGGIQSWDILRWAIAVTLLSCATFIVNEVTDRRDSDKHSWNPVHSHVGDVLNPVIVWLMFWVTTLLGLLMSIELNLGWWGFALWAIGVLYSFEPIRFKRRFGLDIAAQLFVWWIVPFVAPIWGIVPHELIIAMVVVMSFVSWSIFYPYQIADYEADRKAKLQNTHVVLGVRQSTQMGFLFGIIGTILFFLFGFQRFFFVLMPLCLLQIIAFYTYSMWLSARRTEDILRGMQGYVKFFKPIGLLFPLYFFLWWKFGHLL